MAVDPTSPFTGGAVLGDRVRMQRHAGDAGVFVPQHGDARPPRRPVAHDGRTPSLVLDAAGNDVVIIETVGVGQDEVDVMRAADVSVVDAGARAPATTCRRSRPASWRLPTSSS